MPLLQSSSIAPGDTQLGCEPNQIPIFAKTPNQAPPKVSVFLSLIEYLDGTDLRREPRADGHRFLNNQIDSFARGRHLGEYTKPSGYKFIKYRFFQSLNHIGLFGCCAGSKLLRRVVKMIQQ